LGIHNEGIEKGRPWQSYLGITFSVQRRMANYPFARAENRAELSEEHERWMTNYNAQEHNVHQQRKDGSAPRRKS
jgi:hypothetical protein